MKNFSQKLTVLVLFLLFAGAAIAQDKIYLKDGDVIECKITEVGEDQVKYTSEATDDVVMTISTMRIQKIVFASGKEMTFSSGANDPGRYHSDKRNAFKFGLFSPLTGATSFGYERNIAPGRSLEATVGIIGLGWDESLYQNQAGGYIKAGYKFINAPNYQLKGMTYSSLLRGWYVRPEIAFTYFDMDIRRYNQGGFYEVTREGFAAAALLLNVGYQWVLGDAFLIDFYGGIGYGVDNVDYNNTSSYYYDGPDGYFYGFAKPGDAPIAFTGGIKIGLITK